MYGRRLRERSSRVEPDGEAWWWRLKGHPSPSESSQLISDIVDQVVCLRGVGWALELAGRSKLGGPPVRASWARGPAKRDRAGSHGLSAEHVWGQSSFYCGR